MSLLCENWDFSAQANVLHGDIIAMELYDRYDDRENANTRRSLFIFFNKITLEVEKLLNRIHFSILPIDEKNYIRKCIYFCYILYSERDSVRCKDLSNWVTFQIQHKSHITYLQP